MSSSILNMGTKLLRSVLVNQSTMLQSSAGFKVKAQIKLRCRSCYFVRVDGRLHVECNDHPRHKQREIYNVKALW